MTATDSPAVPPVDAVDTGVNTNDVPNSRVDGHNRSPSRALGSLADKSTKRAKIMIVDDKPCSVMVVRKYLQRAGYHEFITTSESAQALQIIRQEDPDLVLLDINMPEVNGLDILETMRGDERTQRTPVLILTAANDAETKLKALELGANEFLAKPVDPSELALRVRNTLVAKAHHYQLANYSERLEHQVRLRTSELDASRREAIHCLARAAEYRDEQTGFHVIRVGRYVGIIRSAGECCNSFL